MVLLKLTVWKRHFDITSPISSAKIPHHADPNDRAYFPTHDDLRNHIYRAKQALQHSKYDQENLRLKLQNWKTHPDANFFFRPRVIDSDHDSTAESEREGKVDCQTEQSQRHSFLWVHQYKWQKDLLKYGNTICLLMLHLKQQSTNCHCSLCAFVLMLATL